jgi:hypothetical protein
LRTKLPTTETLGAYSPTTPGAPPCCSSNANTGELCRVRYIMGIVLDENGGKARERKNALDSRNGKNYQARGGKMVRSRHQSTRSDLDSVVGGRRNDQQSRMAWRLVPAAPMERLRFWGGRERRHGQAAEAGTLPPLYAVFQHRHPNSHGRASPSAALSLGARPALPRWTWAGCRLCLSVFFFFPPLPPQAPRAGRVRRAQENLRVYGPVSEAVRLLSTGPFEAHWL